MVDAGHCAVNTIIGLWDNFVFIKLSLTGAFAADSSGGGYGRTLTSLPQHEHERMHSTGGNNKSTLRQAHANSVTGSCVKRNREIKRGREEY